MDTKETEIDNLTRQLMQGTAEKPSSSLNTRIMALIGQTRTRIVRIEVSRIPSAGLIWIGLVCYAVFVAVGAACLWAPSDATIGTWGSLKKLFPLFLTVGGAGSLFFCLAQLDNWLLGREKNRAKPDIKEELPS